MSYSNKTWVKFHGFIFIGGWAYIPNILNDWWTQYPYDFDNYVHYMVMTVVVGTGGIFYIYKCISGKCVVETEEQKLQAIAEREELVRIKKELR